MSKDKVNTNKPISIKNVKDQTLNENFSKLLGNIMFNKTNIVKENIIKELDIRESQFETILRKDSNKFTTVLCSGRENSIITEQYFYEGKYLFTIDTIFTNTIVREDTNDSLSTVIHYIIVKEDPIPKLRQLPLVENKENENLV